MEILGRNLGYLAIRRSLSEMHWEALKIPGGIEG